MDRSPMWKASHTSFGKQQQNSSKLEKQSKRKLSAFLIGYVSIFLTAFLNEKDSFLSLLVHPYDPLGWTGTCLLCFLGAKDTNKWVVVQ